MIKLNKQLNNVLLQWYRLDRGELVGGVGLTYYEFYWFVVGYWFYWFFGREAVPEEVIEEPAAAAEEFVARIVWVVPKWVPPLGAVVPTFSEWIWFE